MYKEVLVMWSSRWAYARRVARRAVREGLWYVVPVVYVMGLCRYDADWNKHVKEVQKKLDYGRVQEL